MSLSLEPYVFPVLERHFQLQEILGEHSWGLDMDDGRIVFTLDGSGEELKCPVQILGTLSYETETWLWAWHNKQSDIPAKLLKCGPKIEAAARKDNCAEFLAAKSFPLQRENHAQELAIIATGACGLLTFYSCELENSSLFVGIEACPAIVKLPRTAGRAESVLTTGISMFDLQHQPAVTAFLGAPAKTVKSTSEWVVEGKPFRVTFDSAGRISKIRC